jgi:uncharacterized protein (DUF362 family)
MKLSNYSIHSHIRHYLQFCIIIISMQSKVSLVKSKNHYQGVVDSLKLIRDDISGKLAGIDQIVIKINFVNIIPELATTPFEAVKAFIEFILPFYKGKIIIAEESTGGDTKEGFEMYGFREFADGNSQVKLLDLADDEGIVKTITYPEGEITIPLSKTIVKAPFLVSITRPKTHDAVVVTLGIKNVLVGAIKGKLSNRVKIHQGNYIHNILTSIAEFVYPDLVILDGAISMQGDGPDHGDPINSNWALASLDALAADSLATYLMGFDINDVGYLNMLRDGEFGLLYPKDEIEVVGENPKDLVIPFKPHSTFEEQREWEVENS